MNAMRMMAAASVLLAGCAGVDFERSLAETNQATHGFTEGKLDLRRTEAQRAAARQTTDGLLAQPLSMADAVQVAIANSPAMQALMAQGWSDMAASTQLGRIANPMFAFERFRLNTEVEISRALSFGLLELLTLPQRQAIAEREVVRAKFQLASTVVDHVTQVRHAWVRAVGARQVLQYAEQVARTAGAAAELARRMQQVGNFTKLERARQHAFHADAVTQLALAQQASTAAREELVRLLGLDTTQAAQLVLPPRLPDLPAQPREAADVSAAAIQARLDVQLARAQLDAAARAQGLVLADSLLDIELTAQRDTAFDNDAGARATGKGFELGVRLPLFDWGDARRADMDARSLAAANRYDSTIRQASSELRESYAGYRTAYAVAGHFRDEIVPLRKLVAEENVLRYNGMLIGVFELLADSREQIGGVVSALNAQQQFWLADASLSASIVGKPVRPGAATVPVAASASAGGQGH